MFCSTRSFPQSISNISFINETADKEKATFGDGVRMLMLAIGKKPGTFNENIDALNKDGITTGIDAKEDDPLRKGRLSLMIARQLNLGDSLMYKIFKTERYAFRVCAANGIMSYDGSEWDILSGGELVEIITKISELTGGNE